MIGPLRWLRNRRADKAARDAMTTDELAIADGFGIPPRMLAGAGTYANAQDEQREWADYVLRCQRPGKGWRCNHPADHHGPCPAWPTAPGVQPISVSHTTGCDPWNLFGRGCVPGCTAPDRRTSFYVGDL